MTITTDWQIEFNGLLMGDGTNYHITSVEGLLDLPELTPADVGRLRRHGLLPGDDFFGGRGVVVELEVWQPDSTELTTTLNELFEALSPAQPEAALSFKLPGVAGGITARANVKVRRRSVPQSTEVRGSDTNYRDGKATVLVEFYATDPRLYDDNEVSVTETLPTAGGGMEFPLTFSLTFGATSTGGTIPATNNGTFESWPTFRIAGPVTNPNIENLTHEKILSFNITVVDGDFLLIDTERRTVLLNGTASRYSAVEESSEWFPLEPGLNDLRFTASTPSSAELTVMYRSAWI